MEMPEQHVIQIAGIRCISEAAMLVAAGVDWLGFPLRLPVHEEDTSDTLAAAIIQRVPNRAECVLITYLSTAEEIADLATALSVSLVQLHGDIPIREIRTLRQSMPGLGIVKSLIVHEDETRQLLNHGRSFEPYVDAFITDTYDPSTGATGATGKSHDWTVSRELVTELSKPLILAGGLTPENVGDAIRVVRPWGVDAHTGVEDAAGRKSPERVDTFVQTAREAFRQIG